MDRSWSSRLTLLLAAASAVLVACSYAGARPGVPTPPEGWWRSSGTTACATRGVLWTPAGVSEIGSCAGIVSASPPVYSVVIGDEIAVHAWFDGTLPGPDFAIPTSSDSSILQMVSETDGGATTVYRAIGVGTADLSTFTFCADSDGHGSTTRQCGIATVTVTTSR